MDKKRGLGKGLGALLGDDYSTSPRADTKSGEHVSSGGIFDIDIDRIQANPLQPRDKFDNDRMVELTDSIKTMGIIQPITLRRIDRHQYQIISGERRYRAAKAAGLRFIPAYIREANDHQMFEMALVENIQREDLNPIEVALSYSKLMEESGLSLENLAQRVGKNRATVNNFLRLLKLPDTIQYALKQKEISAGHARALINVDDDEHKEDILNQIKENDLSVRQVEALVRQLNEKQKQNRKEPMQALPEVFKHAQKELSQSLGTKVQIKRNIKGKGSITLHFSSDKDLSDIIEKLK
jgi:ParB family chromosome partitioning protein